MTKTKENDAEQFHSHRSTSLSLYPRSLRSLLNKASVAWSRPFNMAPNQETASIASIEMQRAPPAGPSNLQLYRSASHISGPDAFSPYPHSPGLQDVDDEMYDRIPPVQKHIVVAILAFCAFLSPQSSTSVLAATPEVAKTFGTTGSIINISNAAYMVFMGLSPIVWGPMSHVFGRRPVSSTFIADRYYI